jgi:hypothetical protein
LAILPVLGRRALLQTHDKIFLTVLFLILLCGVIIGLYLLATEGRQKYLKYFNTLINTTYIMIQIYKEAFIKARATSLIARPVAECF